MNERGDAHVALAVVGAVAGVVVAAGGAIDSFNGTIIAVGLLVTALTGAYTAYTAHRVHGEVKTINSMKAGEQIDAATVARLKEIPHDERTKGEQSHIDAAPATEPPQGPAC